MESTVIVMMIRRFLVHFLGFLCLLSSVNGLLSSKGVNFEGKFIKKFQFSVSLLRKKKNPALLFFLLTLIICIIYVCLYCYLIKTKVRIKNYSVQALMDIKASLHDPHGVLENWDRDAVDPCSWTMVTCSPEYLVIGL